MYTVRDTLYDMLVLYPDGSSTLIYKGEDIPIVLKRFVQSMVTGENQTSCRTHKSGERED